MCDQEYYIHGHTGHTWTALLPVTLSNDHAFDGGWASTEDESPGETESRDVCCNIVNLQIYILASHIWAYCELSWCDHSFDLDGEQDTAYHNLKLDVKTIWLAK